MNRMGVNSPENTKMIVTYWVHKGYDSDELVKLGRKKSISFLVNVAESVPDLDNDIFIVHILAFVKCLKQSVENRNNKQLARIRGVSLRQVMRLKQALNKLARVKGSIEMQGEIEDMVAAFTEKQRMISSLSGDESGFDDNSGGAMSDDDDFDDSDFEPSK